MKCSFCLHNIELTLYYNLAFKDYPGHDHVYCSLKKLLNLTSSTCKYARSLLTNGHVLIYIVMCSVGSIKIL